MLFSSKTKGVGDDGLTALWLEENKVSKTRVCFQFLTECEHIDLLLALFIKNNEGVVPNESQNVFQGTKELPATIASILLEFSTHAKVLAGISPSDEALLQMLNSKESWTESYKKGAAILDKLNTLYDSLVPLCNAVLQEKTEKGWITSKAIAQFSPTLSTLWGLQIALRNMERTALLHVSEITELNKLYGNTEIKETVRAWKTLIACLNRFTKLIFFAALLR